jgi:glycosyltransferase involved in cell wall biosynthesis
VIAMMTRRLVGIPYSIALNANLDWWGGGMAAKFEQSEFVAVNAKWLLDQLRREYPGLHASQALLAPPGVDTRAWVPTHHRTEDSSFDLVTVARVQHGKGHDLAIQAIARLRDSGRSVRLKIVGGGPERLPLESLTKQLGVENAVEFTGSVSEDEVIDHLKAADAFVLASRVEPLGVAYMEAMALELPTIGTDVGGVGEVITHEHDGLLVAPENDAQLATAIARLIDDPGLRKRLGHNARRTIVERFDSRIGASKLYERLFDNPPPITSAATSQVD